MIDGHISHIEKDYKEFEIQNNKQTVVDIFISESCKNDHTNIIC